jgi:phosphatidylinositol-3-phosphatase
MQPGRPGLQPGANRRAATVTASIVLTVTGLSLAVGCASIASSQAGQGTGHASVPSAGSPLTTSAPPSVSVPPSVKPAAVPRARHIVVVVMENHGFGEVIGNHQAPFINSLARAGALLTSSYAVTHPSEPNYLALFSGSTHGITSDQCPTTISAASLASELLAAGLSFTGYAEGLPAAGSPACDQGGYARKHAPWTDFTGLPRSIGQPFSRFPANFDNLPAVSFVIPDLCHDMHDCAVGTGDSWLSRHLAGYASWARLHASLLILTWDEDDGSAANRIATIIVGQRVRPGRYDQKITHYNVLRTIEQAYHLRPIGQASRAAPISGIWRS